ncbi:hypothetical protein Y032_0026g1337 [Ancylostoma ceylanicum]|uniref:Mediator of RNA polymerase II transcription subunit 20 n=1 Tax=Ancylostoma ceylanicum TaxID=53326 RepID=A0A016UU68_9BILA|nr:hypothetical protein Y032_0026g1337 [Ancylostoma ceylanicum]
MGVSWVFEHEKTAKEVERLLEGGGAEQIGTFTVDCLPYIPNDKLQSCIQHNYVLHHSNFPQSSFSIEIYPRICESTHFTAGYLYPIDPYLITIIHNLLRLHFGLRFVKTPELRQEMNTCVNE